MLVIKKIQDTSLLQPFKELCVYLMQENSMIVYVEKKVLEDPAIVGDDSFGPVKKRFCTFREGERPWGLCQAPAPVPGGRRWP